MEQTGINFSKVYTSIGNTLDVPVALAFEGALALKRNTLYVMKWIIVALEEADETGDRQ